MARKKNRTFENHKGAHRKVAPARGSRGNLTNERAILAYGVPRPATRHSDVTLRGIVNFR